MYHSGTQEEFSLFNVEPYSSREWVLLVAALVAGCPNSSLIGYTFRSATLTVESEVFRCLEHFTVVIGQAVWSV